MHTLIISDNQPIRDAIAVLMEIFHPTADVRVCSDLLQAYAILETGRIDVAFVDATATGFGDQTAIDFLEQSFPGVRLLCLGPGANRQSLIELLDAATQPVPRRNSVDSIIHTLRGITPPASPRPAGLTARQHDVLRLLREGRSTKDIARQLGLAVPTVKTHLAALYRLLGARNRVEAVMKPVVPAAGNGRTNLLSEIGSA